jgi:predicted enzyme related to lactoylglutathione lyase
MNTKVWGIVVDCVDPDGLATFWSRLLNRDIADRAGPYVNLAPDPSGGPGIAFQKVVEPKRSKNRVHLDIHCDDVRAVARRVAELGGQRAAGYEPGGFLVMADPEGNEFCLIPLSGDDMDEDGNAHYLE